MMNCSYKLSLAELLEKPTSEMWLLGAEDPDPDEDDLDEDETDGDDDDDKKPKDKKAAPSDPKDRLIVRLKEDKTTLRGQRDTARADVKRLEGELVKAQAATVTDEETRNKIVGLENANRSKDDTIADLRIQIAFLSDTTHQWANPKAALKLLDRDEVEIDDKGKVTGMADALEALVAENPFLIKTPEKSDEDDSEDDGKPKPKQTGTPPKPKRSNTERDKQARKSTLQDKYPGLRR